MGVLRTIENFVFGMDCLGCGRSSEALDPWLCPDCVRRLKHESSGMSFPAPGIADEWRTRNRAIPGIDLYLSEWTSLRVSESIG